MPDESRPPADPGPPPKSDPGGSSRSQPAFDAEDAKRAAAAALTVGQAGLRAAWKRGKEAAAARGVTEETIRQTVERGRAVATEQAKRRGLGQSDLPTWPGSAPSDGPGAPSDGASARPAPPSGRSPSASAGSAGSAGAARAARPAGAAPTAGAGSTGEARRAAAASSAPTVASRGAGMLRGAVQARLFGAAGLGRGRSRPVAVPNRAPLDRRVGAFAFDLVLFAAAFVVLVFVAELVYGVASGNAPAAGGDPLGLSWDALFRVVTFQELGDAVGGSPDWGPLAAQMVYLVGFGAYMIGAEAHVGATAGKKALGLRVVPSRRGGRQVGWQRAAIRNVCRIYDVLISLWPLILFDLAVTLLSPSRQRTGDWFAGTVVIDERARRSRAPKDRPTSAPAGGRGSSTGA
jgi:uncharacterized RDD family membrane protein YckC